ncbi:prion-inhibition and propagation domain-containing protein [Purpureocillium lavendulum]|uniref:Prion-inhibition and propagation domain-containing protein n=1 Tax=Purpureocillium lavendulum TaxID=1247861 RepID=A0AB34G3G5_9HYPO|nr:prion-inhibition and propagation domain-containing protein [Purpureocillium lavendulum]
MAAELVGTTIGVVGLLGQLFDGCVKAYGYFTTASRLDEDSQRLMCKVRIEEMRLVVWGREWGVAEGKFEAHLDGASAAGAATGTGRGGNPQLRALATQILEELHSTVTDFRKLQEKYGLVDEGNINGSGSGNGNGNGNGNGAGRAKSSPSPPLSSSKCTTATTKDDGGRKLSTSRTNSSGTERSWRKEFSLRTKWVIADKDKFTNLLRDLKDFNDGLERLFPPSQLPSFQRAWTHQLLESAERDLAQLSLLETASTGIYPKLETSANLKKLRINLDSKPQSAFKPTFALKVPRAALVMTGDDRDDRLRCQAHHETAGDVVVEWVDYDREAIDERVAHVRRMDDLARMMHSASDRHPDLHSVDCVGYTDDAARARYGLVYKAPASSFSTLDALIASPDLKTPDLDDRVRLAHALAVALWSLHSLDWLHKSLCASNILFFPSAFSTAARSPTAAAALVPDISQPYLSGFDSSRPDLDTALSVASKNPSIADLHRHPSTLRGLASYCKVFDVYSLGLVLLEIGLWKVLQTYHKPHYSAERWRDKVVLAVLVPGLGSKVGRRYREVVELCLRARDDLSSAEVGKLMETVVTKLESIRV